MRAPFASTSTLALSLVLGLAAGCSPTGGGGGGGPSLAAIDACGNKTSGPTTVTGTLSADTAWDAAHSPYVIADGDTVKVGSGATLTLGKCTAVALGAGARIEVDGHLATQGTADGAVTFGPSGSDYWQGITATSASATLDLAYTTLSHGGQAADPASAVVTVTGDRSAVPKATLKVDHVTISDAAASGVNLEGGAAFEAGSTDLTVSGTGQQPMTDGGSPVPAYPVRIFTESAGSLPPGAYTGNAIDGILLKGVDSVAQSETLADPGVPWILGDDYAGGDFAILPSDGATGDVTVTIAAGVTLKLSAGADITVAAGAGGAAGHLLSAGTSAHHVTITGNGGGRWNDISVTAPAWLQFDSTDIDGGGLTADSGGAGATIVADGGAVGNPITAPCIGMMHLNITDSGSVGILLENNAYFVETSDGLDISGTGADVSPDTGTPVAVPLALGADALFTLPVPTHVTGKQPGVWVRGGAITQDTRLYDVGSPYLFNGSVTVGGAPGNPAILAVDPGVTLAFASQEGLTVYTHGQAEGALRAVGTSAKPITFTSWSDSPAAGDWVGVMFEGDNTSPSVASRLQEATIEYAGGSDTYANYACEPTSGDENAALGFFDTLPVASDFTSVTVAHSAGNGTVEGWTGTPVDLKSGNTFTDVAECEAVAPMPASGCGANPSCL